MRETALHCLAIAAALMVFASMPYRVIAESTDKTIVVGSKNFTENRLLAEIMAQLIEAHTDIKVERKTNLGGTIVVFTALRNGQIDFYPEYTGTGWSIHLKIRESVHNPLRAYLRVKRDFAEKYRITWLAPFGFNNSYALAMGRQLADRLNIRRISDLKDHQNDLRTGFSHEFLNRSDGYPGLAKKYGLSLKNLRGMEHGLAYEAIRTGETDLIDTWLTDGKLLRYPIRILEDDRGFFPPYDAAPIIRTETLERYPELEKILNRLAFRINDQKMRELNYQVEEKGGPFKSVAMEFLKSQRLIKKQTARRPKYTTRDKGFLAFFWDRRYKTLELVSEHLWLTAVAMFLAIITAVPIGILLAKNDRLAPAILGAAGVIQTIPSLALLAFMIPFPGLGLGVRSSIAALFLYALLPILRNTYTSIKEVDNELIQAARGMGLKDRQILFQVEIPLSTRTIMAGIRTATVISIGIATLAAFIGGGGLGDPIITGLQLNDVYLILSGAIPAALLAILIDFAIGRLERFIAPKGL